jgi:hypothetical protein
MQAAVVYDESVSGDLSNSGLAATVVGFASGSNQVLGTTGSQDRDYCTFSIPVGMQLDAIMLLPGTTVGSAVGFIAMQAGTQVTLPPFPASAAGLLGWHHYGPSDVGQDILDNMSIPSAGSSGFSIPLTAGSYAIWVQELTPGSYDYGLDFMVSSPAAVPEPATSVSLACGLAAILALRNRSPKPS